MILLNIILIFGFLTVKIFCDVELEFYETNKGSGTQDFSLKFPSSDNHDVQSLKIVKDGVVIIEKSIYEIGEGLELEINGKYLDPGENELEVLFASSTGNVIERNFISVFSPPTIQPADIGDTASLKGGRVWIGSALRDMMNQLYSPARQASPLAIATGTLGAGAATILYRNRNIAASSQQVGNTIKSKPPTSMSKASSRQMSVPKSQSQTLRSTDKAFPASLPSANNQIQTRPPPAPRLPSSLGSPDKVATAPGALSPRVVQSSAVVLGGGAIVIGAQLGRMAVSRMLRRPSQQSKGSFADISRRVSSKRFWGSKKPVVRKNRLAF